MRSGALLYLEEFNRVPEETLNVLITVLAEGEIAVPRLGAVRASAGFRLVGHPGPLRLGARLTGGPAPPGQDAGQVSHGAVATIARRNRHGHR